MSPASTLSHVRLAALLATAAAPACIHATGTLPSGPPPEYEETPVPASATAAPEAPRPAPPPAPIASPPPGH